MLSTIVLARPVKNASRRKFTMPQGSALTSPPHTGERTMLSSQQPDLSNVQKGRPLYITITGLSLKLLISRDIPNTLIL
jgi:hypothetical protein